MADEIKTYGQLRQAIKDKNRDQIIKNVSGKAVDIALSTIPFFSTAKDIFDLIKAGANRNDTEKTNSWLDRLDIDDKTSKIVDDAVEDGFYEYMANKIKNRNADDELENDFDMNQELTNYLSQTYDQRYVAGVPKKGSVSEIDKNKLNMSSKNKFKEALKTKLKQEMSMTGTGASVIPGDGEGVATKGWKAAPSIPNRKSEAIDYKQLWEESELKLGVKYDYKGDSGFISTGGSNDPRNWKFLGSKGKYPYLSVKADLVPSEKQPGKYDGAFDLGRGKGHHIDEAGTDEVISVLNNPNLDPDVKKTLMSAYRQGHITADGLIMIVDLVLKKGSINEGLGNEIGDTVYFRGDIGEKYPSSQGYYGVIEDIIPARNYNMMAIYQVVVYDKNGNEIRTVKGDWTNFTSKNPIKGSLQEAKLDIDDRIKVTYGNEFYGETGTIVDIRKGFVTVEMDRDGKEYSMHSSDVQKTEDEDDEYDEDMLQEGYARFRNETKTRTKPEQFHSAVKEVKKKVNEINRLFEYMNRLQNELKESEGGLKTKKYTENALQQIKEATKQLFFKSTKLK